MTSPREAHPARRDLVAALVCTLLAASIAGCTPGRRNSVPAVDRVGLTVFDRSAQQAIDLSGRTLAGTRFDLHALRGHVVVINVWASWCTECRTESPLLARMSRQLKRHDIAFVGVDERDDAGSARRFAAHAGARYPELFDPSSRLLARLAQLPQMGIPSTLVVDRIGRSAARIIGAVHPGELRRALGAAERDG